MKKKSTAATATGNQAPLTNLSAHDDASSPSSVCRQPMSGASGSSNAGRPDLRHQRAATKVMSADVMSMFQVTAMP